LKNKIEIYKNYFYLHCLFFLYSLISVVGKNAAQLRFFSPKFITLCFIALILLIIYAFFWQKILKEFSLVVALSNKGIVVFWIFLWSVIFFEESIRFNNILGALIIIIGIILVTKNDK
jgi:uncharacterized membrane protein